MIKAVSLGVIAINYFK